ncbi:hypothetical protein BGX33_006276 [Mortierella sp. NVP41]|nr:hypothetical protein BGX33_006276 [Mortierella sp. NVP41]
MFPDKCKLIIANALYTCKKGEDPVFMDDCEYPSRCSATKTSISAAAIFKVASNDECVNGCACDSKGPECTSTFPPECGLPENSVVQCTSFGEIPTDPQSCSDAICVVNNGDDFCSGKCTCPGDGASPKAAPEGAACGGTNCDCLGDHDVCAFEFPDSCGFDANAIYTCMSDGPPQKKEDCDATHACVKLSDGAVFTTDDCKCPSDGDVCGDVFPLSCKINTGNVYTCVKGQDPVLKEDCGPGGCIATKDSMSATAAAFFRAAATDTCNPDPCKCQTKELACGLTFPEDAIFLRIPSTTVPARTRP